MKSNTVFGLHEADVQQMPVSLTLPDGSIAVIKIDAVLYLNGFLAIGGWLSEQIDIAINSGGEAIPIVLSSKFKRKDVNEHLHTESGYEHGFSICCKVESQAQISLGIATKEGKTFFNLDPAQFEMELKPWHEAVLGPAAIQFMNSSSGAGQSWIQSITSVASPCKCGIDHVLRWPDIGAGSPVIIAGWLTAPEDAEFLAGGPDGKRLIKADFQFYNRPDIACSNNVYINSRGNGFIGIIYDYELSFESIGIFMRINAHISMLAEKTIETFYDYRKFIKASLEIKIDKSDAAAIYSKLFLHLFSTLQMLRYNSIRNIEPVKGHAGNPQQCPASSVIIPLYGDLDLLETQFSRFAWDRAFHDNAELVYVIDDPGLINAFKMNISRLQEKYAIAVSWIYWHGSQGFAGACNLGASIARGEMLIFMNSDVFPDRPGWIDLFQKCFADNLDAGVVGCRLLHPDASPQHCGARLRFDPGSGIWRGEHILSESNQGNKYHLQEMHYVTGACIAVKKTDFEAVNAFSVDYLIGDYDDADLCMKIRSSGKKVFYCSDIVLTHIWHESFRKMEQGPWLDRLHFYNAVVFGSKWNQDCRQMAD